MESRNAQNPMIWCKSYNTHEFIFTMPHVKDSITSQDSCLEFVIIARGGSLAARVPGPCAHKTHGMFWA